MVQNPALAAPLSELLPRSRTTLLMLTLSGRGSSSSVSLLSATSICFSLYASWFTLMMSGHYFLYLIAVSSRVETLCVIHVSMELAQSICSAIFSHNFIEKNDINRAISKWSPRCHPRGTALHLLFHGPSECSNWAK